MPLILREPHFRFSEADGTPLERGYVYIGEPGEDPQEKPVDIFWDNALTIPALQPLRTVGGYPSRDGTAASVFTAREHSITVLDRNRNLIHHSARVFDDVPGNGVEDIIASRIVPMDVPLLFLEAVNGDGTEAQNRIVRLFYADQDYTILAQDAANGAALYAPPANALSVKIWYETTEVATISWGIGDVQGVWVGTAAEINIFEGDILRLEIPTLSELDPAETAGFLAGSMRLRENPA